MQAKWIRLLLLLFAAASLATTVPADVGPNEQQAKQTNVASWRAYYQDVASKYDIALYEDDTERTLRLLKKPVMTWVSLNSFNGSVFIWTDRGRPQLAGTVFGKPSGTQNQQSVMHEFHSLAVSPLTLQTPDGNRWECKQGIKLKQVPKAPPPADSPARRRLQLRSLARRFTAHMMRRDQRWELRLLPQPIYRYEGGKADVLGGAVFAFVGDVTDPEILLLIEARQSQTGPQWLYALARFSDKSLWVRYRNEQVWESLRRGHGTNEPDTKEPHYKLFPAKLVSFPLAPRTPTAGRKANQE